MCKRERKITLWAHSKVRRIQLQFVRILGAASLNLLKLLGHVRVDLVDRAGGQHVADQAALCEDVEDRARFLLKRVEALAQCLDVVVVAAAALAALKHASDADLLRAVEVEHEAGVDLVRHGLLPPFVVFQVAREAIDEELLASAFSHGLLNETDGNLDRDNGALLDVVVDEGGHFRPRVSLSAQQVARRQMHKAEILDNALALRALASARAAQDKHNVGQRIGIGRVSAGGRAGVFVCGRKLCRFDSACAQGEAAAAHGRGLAWRREPVDHRADERHLAEQALLVQPLVIFALEVLLSFVDAFLDLLAHGLHEALVVLKLVGCFVDGLDQQIADVEASRSVADANGEAEAFG
eukprot:m.179517 g.179517  ORF g.179517 m.179517 type:complete len:353 (-) comp17410_c1_seq5:1665-2723(-)